MTDPADALVERLLDATVDMMDVLSIALGDRLAFYRCLAERGALSAGELADSTGTVERYAREWLEQQAVTGLLEVSSETSEDPSTRRFRLRPGVAQVLAEPDEMSFLHAPQPTEPESFEGGLLGAELAATGQEHLLRALLAGDPVRLAPALITPEPLEATGGRWELRALTDDQRQAQYRPHRSPDDLKAAGSG